MFTLSVRATAALKHKKNSCQLKYQLAIELRFDQQKNCRHTRNFSRKHHKGQKLDKKNFIVAWIILYEQVVRQSKLARLFSGET